MLSNAASGEGLKGPACINFFSRAGSFHRYRGPPPSRREALLLSLDCSVFISAQLFTCQRHISRDEAAYHRLLAIDITRHRRISLQNARSRFAQWQPEQVLQLWVHPEGSSPVICVIMVWLTLFISSLTTACARLSSSNAGFLTISS